MIDSPNIETKWFTLMVLILFSVYCFVETIFNYFGINTGNSESWHTLNDGFMDDYEQTRYFSDMEYRDE